MTSKLEKLNALKNNCIGYWPERILSQLEYASKLSKEKGDRFDKLVGDTILFLDERYHVDGAITKASAQLAENMIQELSPIAKSFSMICAAHAHIDMNWMWGYAETVAVTLDTFRTMLNLMKEYPEFTFSQSQASVYKIVEENDPAMLEEIKARVKEGRWEVTASTWVETDKNMPNGESLARHILYSKKYLARLLDIDPDSLKLDFEPDTFGHSRNVPDILANGGVSHYYHCRGYEGYNIYRWEAPSGKSVIVYREPLWYNASIDSGIALHIPEFCMKYGIDTVLKVYGVGDHGGGPTRRDIEKLIDMSAWPVFPSIRFGTFAEFFNLLDKIADKLPIVKQELNFIFTGCYTTQTRIKLANRISEAKMNEAEMFSTMSAAFSNGRYPGSSYKKAWEKVLFNHFHDILPGSGIIETREYAMGQFQQVLAAANTGISQALRNIAAQIDTTNLAGVESGEANCDNNEEVNNRNSISEGAGVGYAIYDYGVPQTERGSGKNRIIHFFNPSPYDRSEAVEVTIWDWPGDTKRIKINDAEGNSTRCQVLDGKLQQWNQAGDFWGHKYIKLLVDIKVPAYGYSTYTLGEKQMTYMTALDFSEDWRVEKAEDFVLENDYIRVGFDSKDISIISYFDKVKGREMVDPQKPAGIFRLIEEDDAKGMTAWTVGRYMNITNLNRDVKVHHSHINKNELRQCINYDIAFRDSRLSVCLSLDYNSPRLDFHVECDWQEKANKGKYIPQLNFHMPFAYKCSSYKYDIPFGTIVRDSLYMDVPANSWAVGMPDDNESGAVMVTTGSKYGFRGNSDSISIALIRSSYDPDPYPENGIHKFRFAVMLVQKPDNAMLINKAYEYNHPVSFLSGVKHGGTLPPAGSFMSLESGTVAVSALKMPEEPGNGNRRMIIRSYEVSGLKSQAVLKFGRGVAKAWYVDINENAVENELNISVEGNIVRFDVEAYSIVSICAEFDPDLV